MSIFRYVKDRHRLILYFFLMVSIVDLILVTSTDLNKSIIDILYLNMLLLTFAIIFLIIEYFKWRNTYKELKDAIECKENIDSYIPKGKDLETILIGKIINLKNEEKTNATRELKEDLEEIIDYITRWVHQIKIPLSVCKLIADRLEDEGLYDLSRELRQEMERTNFLVKQVLYISRSSSYFHDFIVEEINLENLVKSVVKNNMSFFMAKKIELEMGTLDYTILTDRKWAYYVVEQIINNSCKYVDVHGKIQIYGKETEESVILFIKDNGMGISEKDIGRIFDKGFTGDNGRKVGKSTGMGLYICKKISEKLNFEIQVSSQVAKYTEFKIIFYKMSDYLKVTKM